MGRLAELYEKKALGTLTEAEKKEMDTLLAEAKMAEGDDAGTDNGTDDEEADVDAAAQKMADVFQSALDKNNETMKGILQEMKDHSGVTSTKDLSGGKYFVNKELGEKSVKELGDIKIDLPGRETKKHKQVSMRTTEFLKAFFQNDVQKLQILSEGTAADGGVLVPEEFANVIVEDRRDNNIMRQLAAPAINIKTDTFHLPSLVARPKAAWVAEKAQKQTSTATFAEQTFTPYALASIVLLTNQLVADASMGVGGSVVNYIAGLMATSIGEEEEKAFWTGNGSSKPTGIDGGAYTLRTVAAASASDSDRADAIVAAKARTPQGYRQRGVWVANMGTWENIAQLKDTQGRYLLSDLAGSETQLLRGRPVYESNYLAGGTLIYADLSYYQIVDREGISISISNEAVVAGVSLWERNLTGVRVEERVDAELTLPAAVTKVTGLGTP